MINKVRQFIEKHGLFIRGERVVVALSGGPDSCALFLSLMRLAKTLGITLYAAHFNHESRGAESDSDESFCRKLAQDYGVEFVSGKMGGAKKPRGLSIEDYYRRKRYAFLRRTSADWKADKIALGHHLNDQAETVLLHLIRGSGPAGLRGFLPIRDGIFVRPLMDVSRKEIDLFLKNEGLVCRQDASNEEEVFTRNRLRLELMPFLRKHFNPSIERTLVQTAEILRREDVYMRDQLETTLASFPMRATGGRIEYLAAPFAQLHSALRYRFAKAVLERFSQECDQRDYGISYAHIQSLVDLAEPAMTGKILCLPGGLSARRDYDWIVVDRDAPVSIPSFSYDVTIPGSLGIPEIRQKFVFSIGTPGDVDYSKTSRSYLDLDRVAFPLTARNRRPGDRITPLGMDGTRKIHDLFIDRKIPRAQRERIVLLSDERSVIWVEGICPAEKVKLTPATKRVLIIEKEESR